MIVREVDILVYFLFLFLNGVDCCQVEFRDLGSHTQ